jgi:hypothetical protein
MVHEVPWQIWLTTPSPGTFGRLISLLIGAQCLEMFRKAGAGWNIQPVRGIADLKRAL